MMTRIAAFDVASRRASSHSGFRSSFQHAANLAFLLLTEKSAKMREHAIKLLRVAIVTGKLSKPQSEAIVDCLSVCHMSTTPKLQSTTPLTFVKQPSAVL
jgi:hypothetical protein